MLGGYEGLQLFALLDGYKTNKITRFFIYYGKDSQVK